MYEAGQTIVQRSLDHDGRIGSVECGRVLQDDADGVVLWVGQGSAVLQRTTVAGKPVRSLPLAEWVNVPLLHGATEWRAPGTLMVTPVDTPHAVWWFFDEDGEFEGWYINLQSPVQRWWGGYDRRDHALDVVVTADRRWAWKDEEEFAERIDHPLYWTAAEAEQIRAEGERLVAHALAGAYLFDGRWCDFRPDPAWPPSALPWWWDQLPPGRSGPADPGPRPTRLDSGLSQAQQAR